MTRLFALVLTVSSLTLSGCSLGNAAPSSDTLALPADIGPPARVTDLDAALDNAQDEVDALRSQLATALDAGGDLAVVQSDLQRTQARLASLQDSLAQKNARIEQLSGDLGAARAAAIDPSDLSDAQIQLSTALGELERTRTQLQTEQSHQQGLANELTDSRRQSSHQRRRIQDQRNRIRGLELALADLERRVGGQRRLEDRLRRSEQQVSSLTASLQAAERRADPGAIDALRRQLGRAERERTAARQESVSARNELGRTTRNLEAARTRLGKVEQQLAALRTENARLKKQLAKPTTIREVRPVTPPVVAVADPAPAPTAPSTRPSRGPRPPRTR